MAVESGVHTPKEEPAWPQVLQSEFKDEICQQHQRPHHHKLEDGVRTAGRQRNSKKSVIVVVVFFWGGGGSVWTNVKQMYLPGSDSSE